MAKASSPTGSVLTPLGVRRICFDRVMPEEYHPARSAAMRATVEAALGSAGRRGASSRRAGAGLLDATAGVSAPARAAIINMKRWAAGSTVKCRFLDGSAKMKKKVEGYAHEWEKHANIKFKFIASGDAEIRISFFADAGSWSALGNDALVTAYFPKFQPTMNYGWLRDDTPEEEYRRVTLHEFGHALGLVHEHQSPSAKLRWNTAEVYRSFSGPPNFWSKADIDHNVLGKYSPKGVTFTSFDPKSIMLYMFDGSLFLDGIGTNENDKLSAHDKALIRKTYP